MSDLTAALQKLADHQAQHEGDHRLAQILAADRAATANRLEQCYPCFAGRCVVYGADQCDGCKCPHTSEALDCGGDS